MLDPINAFSQTASSLWQTCSERKQISSQPLLVWGLDLSTIYMLCAQRNTSISCHIVWATWQDSRETSQKDPAEGISGMWLIASSTGTTICLRFSRYLHMHRACYKARLPLGLRPSAIVNSSLRRGNFRNMYTDASRPRMYNTHSISGVQSSSTPSCGCR